MFIYSGIVVIWDPRILICYSPVSFVSLSLRRAANQNPRASNDNNALKMNIIVIITIFIVHMIIALIFWKRVFITVTKFYIDMKCNIEQT